MVFQIRCTKAIQNNVLLNNVNDKNASVGKRSENYFDIEDR